MVNLSEERLSHTFSALVDPTRRAMLARLEREPGLSISELAQPFALGLPGIMKHLDVLSDAGLISRSKSGRVVTVTLTPAPLADAMAWLERYQRFWAVSLDQLAAFAEREEKRVRRKRGKKKP